MGSAQPRSRKRLRSRKRSFAFILSEGALVLGIGLVVWALVNISAQPAGVAYQEPTRASLSLLPTASVEPTALATATPVVYSAQGRLGERVGTLIIPSLKQALPIVEGTRASDLKKGVGHFAKSVMPGKPDNCVLSGHRDTVFRKLGEVKKGDRLIVETLGGKFTYKVTRIRIVDKDDRTVIVPTATAVLTVTTCYPFEYIGSAPDRYIVSADLVGRE